MSIFPSMNCCVLLYAGGSFPCMLLLQILYQTWMISKESWLCCG
ncbi:hypothetical protein RchiOBHm_Chr2g0153441 [Rosa chinensis]|uniref:Uncharacterized protein n=1 Tax=Rosa chinensis TaxID=74649 RepID=A0A2P6S0R0_ROSCH|nr:hypothetical protein RchiOBHm_Chr2g0153441 [Rosa chinensis]